MANPQAVPYSAMGNWNPAYGEPGRVSDEQSHDSQVELYLATHETSGATALVRKHSAEEVAAPRKDWRVLFGSWASRGYSAMRYPRAEALVGRLRYVLAHGVKESLVERSTEWPGLTCLPQLLGPARRLFQWFSWTVRAQHPHTRPEFLKRTLSGTTNFICVLSLPARVRPAG
ncbi:hypothetical protein [Cystobacter fuscus]|uniref:hypothetical protein n=1 Tax=Cystobacter fuscus TaxID=43 RepID=UPI002B2D8E79|nr:hypothetical protein F0U63_27180 [Cystobacter fuscus]